MNRKFLSLFKSEKPILAMLHLKRTSDEGVVRYFRGEIVIYAKNGVNCVTVENYSGNYRHMEMALDYISKLSLVIPYGVNCLNVDPIGFELAEKYGASFVQLDSVIGHVKPHDETTLDTFFKLCHEHYQRMVLDSVQSKYQSVLP